MTIHEVKAGDGSTTSRRPIPIAARWGRIRRRLSPIRWRPCGRAGPRRAVAPAEADARNEALAAALAVAGAIAGHITGGKKARVVSAAIGAGAAILGLGMVSAEPTAIAAWIYGSAIGSILGAAVAFLIERVMAFLNSRGTA